MRERKIKEKSIKVPTKKTSVTTVIGQVIGPVSAENLYKDILQEVTEDKLDQDRDLLQGPYLLLEERDQEKERDGVREKERE